MARVITRTEARALKIKRQDRVKVAERRHTRDTNAQGYLTDEQSSIERLMRSNRSKGL